MKTQHFEAAIRVRPDGMLHARINFEDGRFAHAKARTETFLERGLKDDLRERFDIQKAEIRFIRKR